jgi:hypothetical protein
MTMKIDQRYVARLLSVADENAAEALTQLSSFWSGRAKLSEAGELTGLSPAETAAHLALWYFGEVGNGGHAQYFMNPIGSLAHETLAALEKLRLEQAAKTLRDAFEVFPRRQVPKEPMARLAAIEALNDEHVDLLHGFDSVVWAIMGQVNVDILRYLRQHKDEVLTPEQA